MRILVTDFIFAEGHKRFNIDIIRAISRNNVTDVISLNNYYDELNLENVNILSVDLQRESGGIKGKLFNYQLMKYTSRICKNKEYDIIICLAFDTIAMGASMFLFDNSKMVVIHHKNIDELSRKYNHYIFNLYKNRLNHIVFEEHFRKHLIENYSVDENLINVIPHPVEEVDYKDDTIYNCVGLCSSNDEAFIEQLINNEEKFIDNQLTILVRSKLIERSGGAVEVIKGFFPEDVYNRYTNSGKFVLVPLENSYKYRLSGVMYDAFKRRKRVITNHSLFAKEYGKLYPGIIYYFEKIDEIFDILKKDGTVNKRSFDKFIEDHSIKIVAKLYQEMIDKIRDKSK